MQVLERKVDVRLHGKENSNSHGARPVHLIIAMIKWIRTSRLSIKNSLCRFSRRRAGRLEELGDVYTLLGNLKGAVSSERPWSHSPWRHAGLIS